MIRAMRIANVVLLALWVLGGSMSFLQGTGGLPELLGKLTGLVAFGAPFYLSWRGLGPQSALKVVQRARTVNIVLISGSVLVAVVLGAIAVLSDSIGGLLALLPLVVALLMFVVPAILNIKALRKRKAELDQRPV